MIMALGFELGSDLFDKMCRESLHRSDIMRGFGAFYLKRLVLLFLVNFDLANDTLNADLRGDVQCPPSCTRRREMAQLIAFCSHVDCWRCYLGWSLCNRNCRMLEVTNFQIKFCLARTNSHES